MKIRPRGDCPDRLELAEEIVNCSEEEVYRNVEMEEEVGDEMREQAGQQRMGTSEKGRSASHGHFESFGGQK